MGQSGANERRIFGKSRTVGCEPLVIFFVFLFRFFFRFSSPLVCAAPTATGVAEPAHALPHVLGF